MQVKSPYLFNKVKPKPNLLDVTQLMQKMKDLENLISEVEVIKENIKSEHNKNQEQFKSEHGAKLKELDKVMQSVLQIQKGEPGVDAPVVDTEVLIQKILSLIPTPKDGITPEIDTLEIAKAAAKFVKVPEVKIPEVKIPQIDHAKVADEVLSMIEKGKKKLSIKHLGDFTDGLEQTLRPIRSLMAGFRGGGDVVLAGSNVSITTDANGKKVINSTGGSGFTVLAATETPDGSRTQFTLPSALAKPSYLVVDNVWMKATTASGTVNWTWSGTVATLTIPAVDDIWGVV